MRAQGAAPPGCLAAPGEQRQVNGNAATLRLRARASQPGQRPRLTQGTDRCRCAACGEFFGSTYAFDRHRTGEHGVSRRCRSTAEMEAKGMSKGRKGFWITGKMPARPLWISPGPAIDPQPAPTASQPAAAAAA